MATATIKPLKRFVLRTVVVILTAALLLCAIVTWAWHLRGDIADTGLHAQVVDPDDEQVVTAIWLGVTTLLFDDGETQILVDGFISRPSLYDVLLRNPVSNDAPMINYAMDEFGMQRLAAIIPVHSHFDHAMDVGALANRSSASIIGSESTANIARGSGVPEDQILVAKAEAEYVFGEFTVTLIPSAHAPVGLRGEVPMSGRIETPLTMPAPVTAWREGGSYSIVIAHPEGTTLVQGSAGYIEGELDAVEADVVMLGVGLLGSLGRDYAERYWQAVVTATGAKRVLPIHFDDYTQPFGEIRLFPKLVDDFANTAAWLRDFRDTWDTDTLIFLPVFAEPILLYPGEMPDA